MAWCHLEMSSDQHSTVATPSASSLMGDKIITPGTHVTHRKNIQPMNNSWYFYAFWLFFQQFSDCLRGCGVSIVYGKDPCYASRAVCDYKDTISEKRTKTPIKSSDFLLHPFSFLVLPLLGFVPQQWPSKSWDYISLSEHIFQTQSENFWISFKNTVCCSDWLGSAAAAASGIARLWSLWAQDGKNCAF